MMSLMDKDVGHVMTDLATKPGVALVPGMALHSAWNIGTAYAGLRGLMLRDDLQLIQVGNVMVPSMVQIED